MKLFENMCHIGHAKNYLYQTTAVCVCKYTQDMWEVIYQPLVLGVNMRTQQFHRGKGFSFPGRSPLYSIGKEPW